MTLLVKDEADLIYYHIKWHLSQGIDFFVITDNGSKDGTLESIKNLICEGIDIVLIEDDSGYDQQNMVDRMIRVAIKRSADWIINSDADEFWISKGHNIRTTLQSQRHNVIYVPVFNVLPSSDVFYRSDQLIVKEFKKKNNQHKNYFNFHPPSVIHLREGYKMIHSGNHDVDFEKKNSVNTNDLFIAHYYVRSLDHFIRKFLINGEKWNESAYSFLDRRWTSLYYRHKNELISEIELYHDFMLKDIQEHLAKTGYIKEFNDVKSYFNNL
jgi:hypothetical protein